MAKLKITNKYGIIPNNILSSKELSFKAKWLFGYLQSKPDDRDFSAERIANYEWKESRDAVLSWLKELEDCNNIKVFPHPLTEATTDIMTKNNIGVLVRGIRNSKDAEDELVLNSYYKQLKPDLEEVLLVTNYPAISSTFVNECIKYNKLDLVSKLVPFSVIVTIKATTPASLG